MAHRVAAAFLAGKLTGGLLPTPFTARDVYRNAWTGLTEPRFVHRALEVLADLGWVRAEPVRAIVGGRPTVRFHVNPLVRRRPLHQAPKSMNLRRQGSEPSASQQPDEEPTKLTEPIASRG